MRAHAHRMHRFDESVQGETQTEAEDKGLGCLLRHYELQCI